MVEKKESKQVFCRFTNKDIALERGDDTREWVCRVGKKCPYWNEVYINEKIVIAPFCLGELEIEKETEIKYVVIICRHLMPCRGIS